MDWGEALAAMRDSSLNAGDSLHSLRDELDETDEKKARALIAEAVEVASRMLTMVDEWIESAEDDGKDPLD